MRFPTQQEFEAFKYGIFQLVDAALWVVLLLAVLALGLKHIPRLKLHRQRGRKT
jgi:hypothetical protein